jgi:histidine triad (HIT) family protein
MSDCLFCKIVAGEIPAKVVAESDSSLAFYDIAPQAPVHVLVIPKKHYAGVNDVTDRLVFNVGENGQQTVPHLHVHVLGGRKLTWPPG